MRDRSSTYHRNDGYERSREKYGNNQRSNNWSNDQNNKIYKTPLKKREVWKIDKIEQPASFIISQNRTNHFNFQVKIDKQNKQPIKSQSRLGQLKNKITPIQKIWTSHIKQYLNDSQFVEIYRKGKSLAYGEIEYGKSIVKYVENKYLEGSYSNKLYQSNIFSRAYFKLWEILQLGVLDSVKDKKISIGCVAQGPGGFIHSIIDYRLKQSPQIKDNYYAITLRIDNNTRNAKDWQDYRGKQFFNRMRQYEKYRIKLSYGQTLTGDLLNIKNIDFFAQHDLQNKKCFLVTGDGGIQCIGDKQFDYQQVFNVKLFLGEMLTALKIQQIGGAFILKVYDCSFQLTRQLLTLLCVFYQSVKIVKPITSRPGNSQKYMLCEKFLGLNHQQENKLKNLLQQWTQIQPNLSYFQNKQFVHSIIDFSEKQLADRIKKKLIEVNQLFLKEQEAKLEEGLKLAQEMNNDPNKIENLLKQKRFKQQISYAYKWCVKYGIKPIDVVEQQNKLIIQENK